MANKLRGKKVAFLFTEGVEQAELVHASFSGTRGSGQQTDQAFRRDDGYARCTLMRRGLQLICSVLAAPLALPAVALATTQTAHLGSVSATFTSTSTGTGTFSLHLTIVRAGQTVYDAAPVNSPECQQPYCVALPLVHAVRVLDLESGGSPDVVVRLYSGGAHCCEIDEVYSWSASTQTYMESERDFFNAGAALRKVGTPRRYRFVGRADPFYYAFTDFADSGAPIQIWKFNNGQFIDVTRRYRKLIAHDAALWWRTFKHAAPQGPSVPTDGAIAPWAADEDLLGHFTLVANTLASERRQGNLRGDFPPGQFLKKLHHLLRSLGYTH